MNAQTVLVCACEQLVMESQSWLLVLGCSQSLTALKGATPTQQTAARPVPLRWWPPFQAADLMHLTRGGRDSEDLRHPYLAALRSLLLELLPRPTAAGGLGGGARPAQRGFSSAEGMARGGRLPRT